VKRYLLLLILCSGFATAAQCDLEILDFDPNAATITVAFNNTTNCGGTAGPTGIAEVQFGFQALDAECNAMNQGWDFPWGLSIPDDNNHPGWIYSATTTESVGNWTNLDVWADYNVDPPYYTGDTITFPLDDFYQSAGTGLFSNLPNAFDFWLDQDLSIQAVIWQISYGPTMYADEDGWAEVGSLGGGITPPCCGLYEDSNWEDNWVVVGPCTMQSDYTDGVIDNVSFEVGCIGDEAYYTVDYIVWNYGPDTISEYCIDFWFQDQMDCYSAEDSGAYIIPPGEGQAFTGGPFAFPSYGGGGMFNLSLDSIPDEVITGNNNTTVYLPEMPECPVLADTITILEVDTVVVTQIDTTYIELPPDTVFESLTDTLYVIETDTIVVNDTIPVPINWYFYDTTYIYVTDTLVEYIELPNDTITLIEYDTTYVELPADTIFQLDVDTLYLTQTDTIVQEIIVVEYVYITDTLTEYIYEEIWIDCNTGLPCGEEPPEAPDCSVFVPNTFTPNNDGRNDSFYAVTGGDCWDQWELSIYNRWGDRIWATPYADERWYGQVNSGEYYASDGVYVWVIKAKGPGESLDLQGTVTLFR